MNRKYRASELINVYLNQADKDAGKVSLQLITKSYPKYGFDNYRFEEKYYPGYRDHVNGAEGCIILTDRGTWTL